MKNDKSKVKFGLTAFVVLLAVMSFFGCASAQTIYVPVDYATIQEAINAASPGDTVFVHIGTYYEGDGVSITEDRITLQGEDADRTVIHGKRTVEKVVYVTGDYVNVSGFTVTGGAPSGIYVASSNCLVCDNIADSNYNGIHLDSASNCEIENNTANSNYAHGIYLASATNCNLEDNIANSNYEYGIYLASASNCMLENNIANSNAYGIGLSASSTCEIEDNIANLNGYGIYLSSVTNCNLENNIANSNDHYGIYLYGSSSCYIENNIANLNRDDGIYLYASSNHNHITGNTADANNKYGIHLKRSSTSNTITENNISNNRIYGMYLDVSGDNEIYHNNFINNNVYDWGNFNSWDKGLIIGGNYWSDHVCHGNPSDGTEPYTKIDPDVDAVDNYPFEDPDGWVKAEEVLDTGSDTQTPTLSPTPTIMPTTSIPTTSTPTPTPTPTITPSSTSTIQDSDGDGWDDAQERRAGTNPNNVDTDGDGIWNPKDPNPLVASTPTPTTSIPAFQIIPAIVALLAITYLLRRRK